MFPGASFYYLRCSHLVFEWSWGLFLGWFIESAAIYPFHAGGVCCGEKDGCRDLFHLMMGEGAQGQQCAHTVRLVVEEVVVLGDVCDNTEPIGDFHGDHVFWIQQGRNPQLRLSHIECLGTSEAVRNRKYKNANINPVLEASIRILEWVPTPAND